MAYSPATHTHEEARHRPAVPQAMAAGQTAISDCQAAPGLCRDVQADLRVLADRNSSPSDRERAVLQATDETLTTGAASAATIADCRRLLGSDDAVVELAAAIGTWRLISQVAKTLDIPLEDGIASWPPDGQVSPSGTPCA